MASPGGQGASDADIREEPGPGRGVPTTKPGAGWGGARAEGERSSERQEGARARRVTARTLVLTATRGPGQRHNWTLLCD